MEPPGSETYFPKSGLPSTSNDRTYKVRHHVCGGVRVDGSFTERRARIQPKSLTHSDINAIALPNFRGRCLQLIDQDFGLA